MSPAYSQFTALQAEAIMCHLCKMKILSISSSIPVQQVVQALHEQLRRPVKTLGSIADYDSLHCNNKVSATLLIKGSDLDAIGLAL